MGLELGRALLQSDAVTPDALAGALMASVRDRVSLVRALLTTQAIGISRLEEELSRTAPEAPLQRHPVPVLDLMERLPPRMCESLLAVPVRADPRTGTVDVALADASDAHAADEMSFYLGAPVRVVRSPLGAIESAIAQARRSAYQSSTPPSSNPISVPPPSPVRAPLKTPPWGSQTFTGRGHDETGRAHMANVCERPIPLIPKTPPSERAEDFAIPLARKTAPGEGLLALAQAAQDEDNDEPVVELRRAKSAKPAPVAPLPSRPPQGTSRWPREDGAPLTIPATPFNQVLREMHKAVARDPLMELVLAALRPVAPRTALFAVKKEGYAGWMCTPEFGDRALLADIRVDTRKVSLFGTTAVAGTYVGPMSQNEAHAPLTKFVRSPDAELLCAAIKAAGKPVVIVLSYNVPDPVHAMSVFTEVTRAAGDALERILRAKR